jgi:predicted nucleotidyltransferase
VKTIIFTKFIPMRISERERQVLVKAVQKFDCSAAVWLFGSRTDNSKKGGDIDIAVLSDKIYAKEKIQLKRAIYNELGEQKIDLVISAEGKEPFFRLAVKNGTRIDG